MIVVILGSSGFIGNYFKRQFLSEGFTVYGLDIVEDSFQHTNFYFLNVDLTSYDSLSRALAGLDFNIIINLAATTDLNGRSLHYYRSNFLIPINIANYHVNNSLNVPLIHMSSMLKYLGPGSKGFFYGFSKLLGDNSFSGFSNLSPFLTIIELPSVWGPYMKAPYLSFFNRVLTRSFFYSSFFTGVKSFLFVGNLFVLASEVMNRNLGDCYINACDPELFSSNEFARRIASHANVTLRKLPDIIILGCAALGSFLALLGIPFPITFFRLSNMKSGKIVTSTVPHYISSKFVSVDTAIKFTLDYLTKI
jgi:nucleoside-diphosphate-sugar epimerase